MRKRIGRYLCEKCKRVIYTESETRKIEYLTGKPRRYCLSCAAMETLLNPDVKRECVTV